MSNIRSECIGNMIIKQRQKAPITGTLSDYIGYSHIHHKAMTFLEVYESFALSFHTFAQFIDNILTLNYYLNELYSLEELKCLKVLKMWFSNRPKTPQELEEEKIFPRCEEGHACYNPLFSLIFEQNHPKFVDYIRKNTPAQLPTEFKNNSLGYVKDIVRGLDLVHIEYLCLGKADWYKKFTQSDTEKKEVKE